MEEILRLQVVRRVDVQPAVAVEVDEHDAETRRRWNCGDTRINSRVTERAVAVVAKEAVRHEREGRRRAHEAAAIDRADRVAVEVDLHVVAHVEIEETVAVHVAPARARAVMRVLDPGLFGDVGESAVAVVAVEDDPAEIGDHQVVEAVVVEVADGAADAEARASESGFLGHVAEGAIAIVAIEAVGRPRSVRLGPNGSILDAEQVQPAVGIVIDPRETAADRLVDVMEVRRRVEVDEGYPDLGGDVHEPRRARSWTIIGFGGSSRGMGRGVSVDRRGGECQRDRGHGGPDPRLPPRGRRWLAHLIPPALLRRCSAARPGSPASS